MDGKQEKYEYQVGATLPPDAPSYVVRRADRDLYEGLKAGKFCYILNSRQMGKSSLEVRARKKLEREGVACALIDLSQIGSQKLTADQWYATLIASLKESFGLKFKLSPWLRQRDCLSPLRRLSDFIEEVLLPQVRENILIVADEIDSVLSQSFPTDDFFAFIRACYNRRAENPSYRRLTFCLLGVATPSDLIQDKRRTPFNIGCAIDLTGLALESANPLARGLTGVVAEPERVLAEILAWTGGQPFLTQKLCKLVVEKADSKEPNISQLVEKYVIDNWEDQDKPEHLRTIRDRLLKNQQGAASLLGVYLQILQQGEIPADNSLQQMELCATGLVVKQNGTLTAYNRIYEATFDRAWATRELANIRPYSQAITAWLASERQDKSQLLRDRQLQEALAWAADKSLSVEDYKFLNASQELENIRLSKGWKIFNKIIKAILTFAWLGLAALFMFYLLSPKIAESLKNKGLQNLEEGRLPEARKQLQLAIAIDPENRATSYNQGWMCEQAKNFDCAREKYQRSVELGLPAAYSNLASLYIKLDKDYANAVDLLWDGLELAKQDPVKYALHKNLGWARLEQNRYEEAIEHLEKAISLDKNRAAGYCLLAQVFDRQGNVEGAKAQWINCLNYAQPQNPDEDRWIGMARQRLGEIRQE